MIAEEAEEGVKISCRNVTSIRNVAKYQILRRMLFYEWLGDALLMELVLSLLGIRDGGMAAYLAG